jgi:hypothetical protein
VASSILPQVIEMVVRGMVNKPKEEKPKEEKKEEPKSEPEKKAKGGIVGSASKRADGCAQRGKTRGKIV